MSNIADRIFDFYKKMPNSEELTINDNIKELIKKEDNNIKKKYDNIVLHPYCNKCNKFHRKDTKCKLKGTVSV